MSIPSLLAAPPSQHASKVDPETSTGSTRRNRALLVNEALRDRTLREQIVVLDYEVRGGAAEFRDFIALDINRYKKLAADMSLAED
jgi:hypothetical protein